jgi:hypothetical protein
MTARGITLKRFNGDDLVPVEVWIERTDRNEVQVRIADSDAGLDADFYLTLEQLGEFTELLERAKNEPWRRQ